MRPNNCFHPCSVEVGIHLEPDSRNSTLWVDLDNGDAFRSSALVIEGRKDFHFTYPELSEGDWAVTIRTKDANQKVVHQVSSTILVR